MFKYTPTYFIYKRNTNNVISNDSGRLSPKFARDGVTNAGPTNFQWINGPGTVDRFRKENEKEEGKLHKSLQSL